MTGLKGARGGWLREDGADPAGRRVDTAARRTSQSASGTRGPRGQRLRSDLKRAEAPCAGLWITRIGRRPGRRSRGVVVATELAANVDGPGNVARKQTATDVVLGSRLW